MLVKFISTPPLPFQPAKHIDPIHCSSISNGSHRLPLSLGPHAVSIQQPDSHPMLRLGSRPNYKNASREQGIQYYPQVHMKTETTRAGDHAGTPDLSSIS